MFEIHKITIIPESIEECQNMSCEKCGLGKYVACLDVCQFRKMLRGKIE